MREEEGKNKAKRRKEQSKGVGDENQKRKGREM